MDVRIDLTTVLLGLATVALTGIVSIIVAFVTRKPPKLQVQEQINTAFGVLVAGYEANIKTLASRVDDLSDLVKKQSAQLAVQSVEIEELNSHIDLLTTMLEKHGLKAPKRERRASLPEKPASAEKLTSP